MKEEGLCMKILHNNGVNYPNCRVPTEIVFQLRI